jgi:glycosyltransferase involved in cell wall biosynthesis
MAHDNSGGAEVFVHEVARRWAESGQEVTLFSSQGPHLPSHDEVDGVMIERIGRIGNGTHHLLAPRAIARTGSFDGILESINTFPYLTPLHRRRVPVLTLVHQMALDVWKAHLPQPLASMAAFAEPQLYRPYRNMSLLAVSESTRADLAAAGVHDVSVVPQGGIGRQSKLPGKEACPTFIFVGRLSPNKRPDHAVAAFLEIKRELKDARLWIVGEGGMKDMLAATLPEGAEMLGRLPRQELLDRIGRAHVLLATSVREGWGLVITEASAMGTPSAAYAVPGLVDSVRADVTGLLVDPDPTALAGAALQMISDPDRYRTMSLGAIAWGGEHTWDRTAADLLSRLQRSAASRHRVPA